MNEKTDAEISINFSRGDSLDPVINDWSKESWLENKRLLSDCIWVTGALLRHEAEGMIYLAPEPTVYGIIYEIRLTDVREVIPTGTIASFLDRRYVLSRVYLVKSAVIARISWMTATEIPGEVEELSNSVTDLEKMTTSPSLLDLHFFGPEHPGPGPREGLTKEAKEPKAPKEPKEPKEPRGSPAPRENRFEIKRGSGVSGVRG